MKIFTKFIFSVFFFFNIGLLHGQGDGYCETTESFPVEDVLPLTVPNNNVYCLKTYVHVIRNENEEGGVTIPQINTMFSNLRNSFSPHGINLSWSNDIHYIDNNMYYDTDEADVLTGLFSQSNSDGIDFFLLPESHKVQAGRADGVGENAALYISGTYWEGANQPLLMTTNAIHELGHVLGLNHTFFNECPELELVDGSNCEDCGDGFCDTAPDPGMNFEVDPVTCMWTGAATDANGDAYDPDETNFMGYSNLNCMNNFSAKQMNFMKNRIENETYLQNCIVQNSQGSCTCTSGDLYVSTNTTINSNLDMDGSILVWSGATLTIENAKISFTEGNGIKVFSSCELILDNAHLTKCPSAENWDGINVAGELPFLGTFPPGKLTSFNNTLIEHAKVGIDAVTKFPGYGFYFYFGGGILDVSSTTFDRCDLGINIGYSYNSDVSLNGNTFTNGNFGIKLFKTKGNFFNGNTFVNMRAVDDNGVAIGAGIHSTNSELVPFLSTFTNCDHGIFIDAPTPYIHHIGITGNFYYDNTVGIHAESATNINRLNVDNSFFFGGVGISKNGDLKFDINRNQFYDNIEGIETASTGLDPSNLIHYNNFNYNEKGATYQFQNNHQYLGNCYVGTKEADIYMKSGFDPNFQATSANFIQGEEELSAGNCFSDKKVKDQGMGGSSTIIPSLYHTKDGLEDPESCKSPGASLFYAIDADIERDDICSNPNILENYSATVRSCEFDEDMTLEEKIAQILAERAAIIADLTLDPNVKLYLLNKLSACLHELFDEEVINIIDKDDKPSDENIDDVVDLLDLFDNFRSSIIVYSFLMDALRYDEAQSLILSLVPSNENESGFINSQVIYLDYIRSTTIYTLSSGDDATLVDFGSSNYPYSGFARSIYYRITGNLIVRELPPTTRKSSTENRNIEAFSVYPNPTNNNQISISLLDNYDISSTSRIDVELFDTSGKRIVANSFSGKEEIEITIPTKGLYYLRVTSNGKLLGSSKVINI